MGTVLDPKNAALQRNIAIACKNTGKKELADKAFRKAFELDPASPDTALEMALFLAFACHKNDEASDWYMKAKELGAKPNTLLDRIARK
jgi:Flp pilus assembly protein TadD